MWSFLNKFKSKRRKHREKRYIVFLSIKTDILKCETGYQIDAIQKRVNYFFYTELRSWHKPLKIENEYAWFVLKMIWFKRKVKIYYKETFK